MDNDAKARYAAFLRTVGRYYIMKLKNPPKAAKYNDRAIAVYDQVQGYESFKIDAIYQSILNNLRVGDTKEIAMNIQGIEQIKNSSSINKNDAEFIYFASKAELFYLESKYHDAMEENEKSIQAALNSGIDANNSMLTNRYLLKTKILNATAKYLIAQNQITQLEKMSLGAGKNNNEIFGRILTQVANVKLGLGNLIDAQKSIDDAITIFLNNENQEENVELASAYNIKGDISLKKKNEQEAITYYNKALKIYQDTYNERIRNIVQISNIYAKAAKAAYINHDLNNCQNFLELQTKNFGPEHFNTLQIKEFCTF
jgi:predicted negative regulator of RcsB-dependent stress response